MNLLRFKKTVEIAQNLRLALRLAEEKALTEVSEKLRDALAEAERARTAAREDSVVSDSPAARTKAER